MALAAVVETLESVPEVLHSFYKEIDGKFVLDADIESHPQVTGLRGAYRADHEQVGKLKVQLEKFKDIDLERWRKLQEVKDDDLMLLEKLRIDAETKSNNTSQGTGTFDLEAEIEKRLRPMKSAHQQEIEKREALLRSLENDKKRIEADMRRTRIETALASACAEAGVLPQAVEDIVYVGQRNFKVNDAGEVTAVDSSGVELFGTDGKPMRPREWIASRSAEKAHWFPLNMGGGANGGRFGGDSRPSRKSEFKDLKAKVAFISKHGQKAYEDLAD